MSESKPSLLAELAKAKDPQAFARAMRQRRMKSPPLKGGTRYVVRYTPPVAQDPQSTGARLFLYLYNGDTMEAGPDRMKALSFNDKLEALTFATLMPAKYTRGEGTWEVIPS